MKELSIKEKAKAYDEAKARMSKAYNSNRCTIGFMNEIFPEFKDEDERIKEEIINYFKCQSRDEPCRKSIHDKWIAWIEKQGQTFTKEEDGNANKVEPKFKAGDWVIDKLGVVCQIANVIENVTNHTYGYDIVGGGYFNDNTEEVRLWNIKDAKDGDVLVASDKSLFIYDGSINENGSVGFHIAFTEDMDIILNSDDGCGWEEKDSCHPATKEQRDTLEKAMADAGYTFDFEKKELKKISQRMISAEAKEAMYGKPTAWSEEDENILEAITYTVKNSGYSHCIGVSIKVMIDWLKSLKQRIKL